MRYSAPNAKLCRIFVVKMGHLCLPYSHSKSLVRIAFCVLWCTRGEMLPDFHCRNLATIPNMLAKYWSRSHPLQNQTSKPNSLKSPKASANSLFLTAKVQKLRFYQKKNCLRTGVEGCLTPSLHVTRLPNSRIKNFYPSMLD